VLKLLQQNENGWEDKLPDGVSKMIKEKHLFGYKG
jgi:hypothetical protein